MGLLRLTVTKKKAKMLMSNDTTLDRLMAECQSARDDIMFLQELWDNNEVVMPDDLSEQDRDRLLDICPDYVYDDTPDVWFAFCDSVLELKADATVSIPASTYRPGRHLTLSTITAVFTTGGPHIEVVADAKRDLLTIKGYWSGSECALNVPSHGLLQHLLQYGDEMVHNL